MGIIALAGAVLLVAVVAWASTSHSGTPAQQQRVTIPGVGEHLVNLWVEPADTSGGQRLTAQVTDTGGWPASVSSVVFSVAGADQAAPVEAPGVYAPDGPGRGQVYHAVMPMDGAGPWQVAVQFIMSGQQGEAAFTVRPQ
ncbi:MAG: hypothetical protein WD645_04210 [Dehalococcoidia bacterium]